jgi:hypothetical protein
LQKTGRDVVLYFAISGCHPGHKTIAELYYLESMILSDSLFEGLLIRENAILPWEKPIGELINIGNPKVEKWKRWHQDRDGYYNEIERTRLLWNKVQLPGITSIKAFQIEYEKPTALFKEAELYFNSSQQLEKELIIQFGDPFIHRTEFQDKDGMNENIQKQWILTSPDTKTQIRFLLDDVCKVVFGHK